MPDNEAACQQLQQRIEELEEELSCPITWQPMEDPVLLVASGQTFNRASIEEHWRRGHTRWVLLSVTRKMHQQSAAALDCVPLQWPSSQYVVLVRRCPVTNMATGNNLTLSPNIVVRCQVDGLLRLKAQLAERVEVRLPRPAAVVLT